MGLQTNDMSTNKYSRRYRIVMTFSVMRTPANDMMLRDSERRMLMESHLMEMSRCRIFGHSSQRRGMKCSLKRSRSRIRMEISSIERVRNNANGKRKRNENN